MSANEKAPKTVGAVRGPENQLSGGFEPMMAQDPDFQYPVSRYVPDVTTAWVVEALRQLGELDGWPRYGSIEWHLLPVRDPKRYAAVIEAAEQWRKAVHEHHRREALADLDPEAWQAEVFADARTEAAKLAKAYGAMRTARELKNARATYGPIHQLHATPGWPPIAIPGQPGRYLTYREKRAAA